MVVSSIPGDGVSLCAEQKAAVDRILSSSAPVSVLTGEAGSGKSTVVNFLRNRTPLLVCATTGKAAMHVDGCTVDAAFCIERNNWTVWSQSYQEYVMKNAPDLIVIDEASMIGKNMGNLIEDARKTFRKKLLLVGDWAQARPVKDEWIIYSQLMKEFDFIKLQENHRQDEGPYMDALRALRVGNVTEEVEQLFCSRIMTTPPDDDTVVRMYATNHKTDAYNNARLFRHSCENSVPFFRIFASFEDMREEHKQKENPRGEAFKQNAIDSSRMGHGEALAPGCRVVCTLNAASDDFGSTRPYVNGDTGTLVGGITEDGCQLIKALTDCADTEKRVRPGRLDILLDRTGKVVQIPKTTKMVRDPLGRAQHTVTGFPLRLGYSITIHRAQGMTVPRAWVDMPSLLSFPDDASRHGLAYVALSRTRTLDGLFLSSWCPQAVYCDQEIASLL